MHYYLTVAQASKLIQVSERCLRERIAAGEVPAVRIGRLVRIPSNALLELTPASEKVKTASDRSA